eukprot:1194651-Prorocentrum_minimum.AAC.7
MSYTAIRSTHLSMLVISRQVAELSAEKERLEQAMPSHELLADLRAKPITERANELADDIDRCTDESFLRLMRSVDGQMFAGYRQYIGLTDLKIQHVMEHLASVVAEYLSAATESCIVLGGAGTSGRLAMFCARAFNKLMESHGKCNYRV